MGVSMGKTKGGIDGKKAPIESFRKAAQVVSLMRKTSRDETARLKDTDIQHISPRIIATEAEDKNKLTRRESNVLLDDFRNNHSYERDTNSKVVDDSQTLVFKNTTDAWAALREGLVMETTEIPETEFVLVESSLGGYKTVERVRDDTICNDSEEDGIRRQRAQSNDSDFKIPYVPLGGFDKQVNKFDKFFKYKKNTNIVMFEWEGSYWLSIGNLKTFFVTKWIFWPTLVLTFLPVHLHLQNEIQSCIVVHPLHPSHSSPHTGT